MARECFGKACLIDGCGRGQRRVGLCPAHYIQKLRGIPFRPIEFKRQPGSEPIIRWNEVPCMVTGLGPCHVFIGAKNSDGYGHFKMGNRWPRVHRYVWEKANGPIPAGMFMDHICRNRACCNLNHLRVVTPWQGAHENCGASVASANASRTRCPLGHPYDGENTYWYDGRRQCLTCRR